VVALSELSVAIASDDLAHVRVYARHPGTIGAPKVDSLLRWGRLKGDPALNTQMQANALQRHRTG
jgi:hypothetical protein